MATAYFSTNTELGLVNALNQSLTLYLPQTPLTGKSIFIKDAAGNSLVSTITVRPQGTDIFEDGSVFQTLNSAYESLQLVYNSGKWYINGGTMFNTVRTSTLQALNVFTSNLSSLNTSVSTLADSSILLDTSGNYSAKKEENENKTSVIVNVNNALFRKFIKNFIF